MGGETILGLDALNEEEFSIDEAGSLLDNIPGALTPEEQAAATVVDKIPSTEEQNKIIPGEEVKKPSEIVAKDKDEVKTPENMSNSSPGLSKIYSSLATHLFDEGVLPSLNKDNIDITDATKLAEAIKAEITSGLDSAQAEYKKAMETGVPKDDYVSYQKVANQLNGITPELIAADDDAAINLRTNIIAQDFLNRGFDRDEALKYAKRSVDLAEDVNDATSALARLKEHNVKNYNDSIDATKAEETKVNDDIKKFIDTTEEVLKGVKLTQRVKDDLLKQITTPIGNDKNGKPTNAYYKAYSEDPVKYQVVQNYLYMVTKGYTDFSKINNAVESNVSRQIDEVLKNNGAGFLDKGGVNFDNSDTDSSFSLGGDLKLDI